MLSTSHPDKLTTTLSDRVVRFDFQNIFLPDSISDNIGSQGYVNFIIYPNSDLENDDNILNFADIYFDSNPPIRTNAGESIITNELSSTTKIEFNELLVYPNPSNGVIYMSENITGLVTLYSIEGTEVFKTNLINKNQISLPNILDGLYILDIVLRENRFQKKILLSRI